MNEYVSIEFALRLAGKLKPAQIELVKYLLSHDGEFTGSYRELAEALGKPKEQATNACQTVHGLEAMGIVAIIGKMIALNPDWKERI